MSFKSDIDDLKRRLWCSDCEGSPWWMIAAQSAQYIDRSHFIPQRGIDALYLARFWLTPPVINDTGELESGNSTLLHYFAAGDNDEAMHCHPWDFDTCILNGGYTEQLPPDGLDWQGYGGWRSGPEMLTENQYKRRTGDRIEHRATDLHMAMDPLPDTWTLVQTGQRFREWGFHPPGKKWQPYDEYLNLPTQTQEH